MKARIALTFALLMMAMPTTLTAQEPETETAAAGELDLNKDGKVDADEMKKAADSEAGVGDVVKDVTKVVDAVQDVKDNKAEGKAALIMVLLGAIFKLLLSGIKLIKKETNWFHAKKAKRIVKYTTLLLGAAAGLMANVVFGMGWIEAGIIVLSGPISVAIHEYTKDSKDGDPDAT